MDIPRSYVESAGAAVWEAQGVRGTLRLTRAAISRVDGRAVTRAQIRDRVKIESQSQSGRAHQRRVREQLACSELFMMRVLPVAFR